MTTGDELRRAPGGETKRAILEAAMALYARRGVKGTGLAAIGQAAGVTHAGVLYHFGSSRRLLLAVLDARDRRFWQETAPTWRGRSGLDALRELPRLAEWNRDNWELAKLFTVLQAENLDPDDEAHGYFVERRRRVRGRIQRALEEGQRTGEIRPDVDARTKADEAVAFMDGAQMSAMLDPQVDLVAIFASYADAFVDGIAAARGGTRPGHRVRRSGAGRHRRDGRVRHASHRVRRRFVDARHRRRPGLGRRPVPRVRHRCPPDRCLHHRLPPGARWPPHHEAHRDRGRRRHAPGIPSR